MRSKIHAKRIGNYPRGEQHVAHKLTDADVIEMRKSYKEGERQVCLAQKYGIAQGMVSKIVNGQTWQHLPM